MAAASASAAAVSKEENAVPHGAKPTFGAERFAPFISRSPLRLQWLRIAQKHADKDFVTYDIIDNPGSCVNNCTSYALQVRGRSVIEAVMAYMDYLNKIPCDDGRDAYEWANFKLNEDDAVADEHIATRFTSGHDDGEFFWLREVGPPRVLVVQDMPGTRTDNKRARSK